MLVDFFDFVAKLSYKHKNPVRVSEGDFCFFISTQPDCSCAFILSLWEDVNLPTFISSNQLNYSLFRAIIFLYREKENVL